MFLERKRGISNKQTDLLFPHIHNLQKRTLPFILATMMCKHTHNLKKKKVFMRLRKAGLNNGTRGKSSNPNPDVWRGSNHLSPSKQPLNR